MDDPVVTVHQSIGEAKEQFYYERTVFLRCVANSNPPVRYSWRRGQEVLLQGSDKGVEIYEPFFTQVGTDVIVFPPHSAGYFPNSGSIAILQILFYLKRCLFVCLFLKYYIFSWKVRGLNEKQFVFHVVVTCIKLPLENKLNECILNISLSIGLPRFHTKVHKYTFAVCFVFFFVRNIS